MAVIIGDENDNRDLDATEADDTISGLGGRDHLFVFGGADLADAGSDDDFISVSDLGAHTLIGGDGEDVLIFGLQDTAQALEIELRLVGGELLVGDAHISGIEDYRLNLGRGHDIIHGGTLRDVSVNAGAGADEFFGGRQKELFEGGKGNDTIDGGRGADTLEGGAGNDVLIGGGGRDLLIAGPSGKPEVDTMVFADLSDMGLGNRADIIKDMSSANDVIDLSGVDADVGANGDQAFVFIGDAEFSGMAGELRFSEHHTNRATLEVDVDGDGVADAQIRLSGGSYTSFDNFIL